MTRKRARSGRQARFTAGDRRAGHVAYGGSVPRKKGQRRQDGPLVQAVEKMLDAEGSAPNWAKENTS